MRAFIIHTPDEQSIQYAEHCLSSFEHHSGWEPELFEGVTPKTLIEFEQRFPLKRKLKSRMTDFLKNDPIGYVYKKCCSMNHYRLFLRCIEMGEPIAVIEHDSYCVGDWNNSLFEDVLVLNIVSAMQQSQLGRVARYFRRRGKQALPRRGVHDLSVGDGPKYHHDPKWNGAQLMLGTAAYAVTPKGAQKMISVYEKDGWEQSDFIINTHNVRIQTIVPELFTFDLPNLKTSHGAHSESSIDANKYLNEHGRET